MYSVGHCSTRQASASQRVMRVRVLNGWVPPPPGRAGAGWRLIAADSGSYSFSPVQRSYPRRRPASPWPDKRWPAADRNRPKRLASPRPPWPHPPCPCPRSPLSDHDRRERPTHGGSQKCHWPGEGEKDRESRRVRDGARGNEKAGNCQVERPSFAWCAPGACLVREQGRLSDKAAQVQGIGV